jgi:hypothetical protein
MNWIKPAIFVPAILGISLTGNVLAATGDEIQVYDDDINKPKEFSLELHSNYIISGSKTPAWEGDAPSHHSFRITPEFAYGLTETLEAGLYLPLLRESGQDVRLEGAKLRLKYLSAPKDVPYYWGLNGELGHVSLRSAEQHWNMELRPIFGYRMDKWQFTVNPTLEWALSGVHDNVPEFSPALRVSYALKEELSLSLEHYAELGKVNHLLPSSQQTQTTFIALDTNVSGHDLNFGVGKGWNGNSDKWTVKAIVNMPF